MRAGARQLAAVDDQILFADRTLFEPAFQNLARACGIASLRRKRRSRNMRRHAVMWHCAPRMVSWRGLGEPDVACIAGELTAFEGAHDRVTVADFATRGVHEISASLHLGEKLVVEEALCLRLNRRVDRGDVPD